MVQASCLRFPVLRFGRVYGACRLKAYTKTADWEPTLQLQAGRLDYNGRHGFHDDQFVRSQHFAERRFVLNFDLLS